ncbi:CPBP family intramembrane glutamic endopeptidase [Pseudoalteromonas luteoviolacea]|uniref:CPBP family intramembrane glutamic endopeptidase n=1 Tax=Pseudoalteromonas luteoviolacea TaxID=43657 RepID=UPI001B38C8C6|nr:CPBP family intramembrane glutamic endopeptidase [Pseudoalteromonas luteoviolacea]MBQ4835520.1 CPBP family intramembrane metalloprotease [Pseudoalteromonas luteoviolacea]
MNSPFELFGLTLTLSTAISFFPALLSLVALTFLMHRTAIGLAIVSVILGYYFEIINMIAALGITSLFLMSYGFNHFKRKLIKWLLGVGIFVFSILFFIHAFPGFSNPLVIESYMVSNNAVPFSKHLNFDKLMVAIALLALVVPRGRTSMGKNSGKVFVLSSLAVVSGLAGGVLSGLVEWEPKLSPILVGWIITNLLVTCYAEEAFFRGFIQTQMQNTFKHHHLGDKLTVFCSGVLFGLVHFPGGLAYTLIATILGIGCAYGYQKTNNILVPIYIHFVFNLLHFCLFTYPFLA